MAATEALSWAAVEVDVLWGKVRGKRVDLKGGGRPVLCLHGWMDNANTFDLLAPHLPSGLTLLSVDLPGHGLSDHLPLGGHYDIYTYVSSVLKVLTQLGWTRVIVVSHSLGSFVATYLAALYPKCIEALVNIDGVDIANTPIDIIELQRNTLNQLAYAERKSLLGPPVYTRDALLEKIVEGRRYRLDGEYYPIDKKIAEILFPRAAKPTPDAQGYVWCHDIKLRSSFVGTVGHENWLRTVTAVTCPVLLIRAADGVSKPLKESMFREIVSAYQANEGSFDYVVIDDKHHLHLTSPAEVAKAITTFFQKRNIDQLCRKPEPAAKL